MKVQTYKLIKETLLTVAIILAGITFSIILAILCETRKPQAREEQRDNRQVDEMQKYHREKGRTNLHFY